MKTYALSEARRNFSELIEAVRSDGDQVAISVNGKIAATIISPEDYESLLETLEILEDQELLQKIIRSEEEIARDEVVALEDL